MTLVVTLLLAFAARADRGDAADEVYGRLIAPCCWNQTLDIHDSEIATQLRVEIAERLQRGEASLSIEDDMASRFGERIRAVPRAQDPRQSMALTLLGTLTLLLLGLFALAFRWTRARAVAMHSAELDPLAEYDERLERELSRAE
ncbi:MAG TPA: cytochrome c-type biogenesis protein CcmH [Polyangiales bacterium]|nr:cytochrome c-type biogenesis protein CcmH [Polyangiales bacterium]